MFKNILITGGCGFLGQYLTKDLLLEFHDLKIKILDLNPNPNPLFDFRHYPNVKMSINKDICDYHSIENEFKNVDLVIHLAGLVSYSLKDKELLERVNVQGTKNILEIVASNNIKNLLHISSSAALGYGDEKNKWIDENFDFDWNIARKRRKYYMLTKHFADVEVKKFINTGLNGVIIFPSAMFGPGDLANSSRLIKAIKNGNVLFNMPGGYSVIDVRDVSRGILAILQRGITRGEYLLTGHNLTCEEINRIIAEELSVRPPQLSLPRILSPLLFYPFLLFESISQSRPELTADNLDSAFKFRYFDNTKAKRELGWQPNFSFKRTIKDTINWMDKSGYLE